MQELIKVATNAKNESVVSARELHKFLEIGTEFKDWMPRMLEYGFVDGVDFNMLKIEQVQIEGNREVKREVKDCVLLLDTAKEISMIQRTEKGKQARLYFIECEKQLMKPKELTRLELLEQAILIERENIQLKEKALLDKPKVEFYDEVADGTGSFDMIAISAMLKLAYGRITLFKKLREAGVLMDDNMPYRKFIDLGYFTIVETKWLNQKTQQTNVTFQTRFTQRGFDWLQKNKQKFKL